MNKEKFLDRLAKFWQVVREQKLLIFRFCGVAFTVFYSLGIFALLALMLYVFGEVCETMQWLDAASSLYTYGRWIVVVLAAAIGGYELHRSMAWAKKKTEMSDWEFDTGAFTLVLTVFITCLLAIMVTGIYHIISMLIIKL